MASAHNWSHLTIMAMTSATCSTCGEVSDPVPIPADWKARPARQHMLDTAFGRIGWDVLPKHAWCPACKNLPR